MAAHKAQISGDRARLDIQCIVVNGLFVSIADSLLLFEIEIRLFLRICLVCKISGSASTSSEGYSLLLAKQPLDSAVDACGIRLMSNTITIQGCSETKVYSAANSLSPYDNLRQ